jgi:hypothetical protein
MKNRTGAYLRLHAMREAAMAAFAKNLAAGVNCGRGASGIVHGSVGITNHAMQSMAIRGHAHNRETAANTARPLSVSV